MSILTIGLIYVNLQMPSLLDDIDRLSHKVAKYQIERTKVQKQKMQEVEYKNRRYWDVFSQMDKWPVLVSSLELKSERGRLKGYLKSENIHAFLIELYKLDSKPRISPEFISGEVIHIVVDFSLS
ncbi:MAG: hypothetical protein HRT90_01090 [Candidatus Margulisbacteria bacterium]|nr:hypothetical protein [Candidatus Margulisiibacteriota bacterium]